MEDTLAVTAAQPYALDSDAPAPDPGDLSAWVSPQSRPPRGIHDDDVEDQFDAVIWAALLRP